jgi:cob(I)alamin adenosyltransferase
VRKDDLRIECVGSTDELSSFLGLARAALEAQGSAHLAGLLRGIQRELYVLGAELSRRSLQVMDEVDEAAGLALTAQNVARLDREVAALDARLPKLRAFVLPGGGIAASCLHLARAVCRRVERQAVRLAGAERLGPFVVPYLNRLSLALFSMARMAAAECGAGDELANEVAPGQGSDRR